MDDVTGMSLAEAIETIEAQGLVVGDRTPQPSEEKKNTVLAQNPPANTEVEEGSTVDLTFSSGPEQVSVPKLVGLPQSEAIAALQRVDLKVGEIIQQDSDQPAGNVLESNPEEGKQVDVGTEVDLVVSTGEVEVPNVVGETESEARNILSDEGFVPDVIFEETDEATAGTVISQIPEGGSTAGRGTVVTITVATEPPTPTPTVTTTSPSPDESDSEE